MYNRLYNNEMEKEDTKRKIIEEALALFQCYGCRRVTMDQVAQQLHISKRTIYECFETKEALLKACLEYIGEEQGNKFCALFDELQDPLYTGIMMFQYNLVFVSKYQNLLDDIRTYYSSTFDFYVSQKKDLIISRMHKGLQHAYDDGRLRRDVNVDICAEFLLNLPRMSESVYPNDKDAMRSFANTVGYYVMRGVLTEESMERYDLLSQKGKVAIRKMLDDKGNDKY